MPDFGQDTDTPAMQSQMPDSGRDTDTPFERCEKVIDDLTNNRITGKQLDRLDKAVDRSKSDQSIGQAGPARRLFGSPL